MSMPEETGVREIMASYFGKEKNILEEADRNYVQELRKFPEPHINVADPIAARKWLVDEYMTWPKTVPEIARLRQPVEVQAETIEVTYGNDNCYAVRVYTPVTSSMYLRPALLMFHGGGFIHGFPEVDEELSEYFASELRAVVISVDYRLAPENKFPCALDDCYQTIEWTLGNAEKYKIDSKRIGLWGCSAGGNLAAAVALRDAVEHQISRLRHVNLVVPVTCHPDLYPEILKAPGSSARGSWLPDLIPDALKVLWDVYAGSNYSHPYASVLLAATPPNHPSTHTTVAGLDYFRDEGIAYAIGLRNAGIDAQLEIIPGVPHGITFPTTTHAARQFFRNQARVLNCALNVEY